MCWIRLPFCGVWEFRVLGHDGVLIRQHGILLSCFVYGVHQGFFLGWDSLADFLKRRAA